jgi:hypothetical protein
MDNQENKYYVYAYLDPRKPGCFKYNEVEFDFEPFYIGKGSGNRIKAHLFKSNLRANTPKNQKIRSILSSGQEPVSLILDRDLFENEAFDKEISYIESVGRGDLETGPLLNLYEGGCGSSKSEETRQKIGESQKTRYKNGVIHPMTGKKHSDETRKRWSQKRQGVKWTPQQREKLLQSRRESKCHFTKTWLVTSPEGSECVVHGLGEFCRDHNLSQPHMWSVAQGNRKHHKGWRCQESNGVPKTT